MDSACILACDIDKVFSQYDENLFADHVCSSTCSCLALAPVMRWSASISTIEFHHFGLGLGLGLGWEGEGLHQFTWPRQAQHMVHWLRLRLGGGVIGSVHVATPGLGLGLGAGVKA